MNKAKLSSPRPEKDRPWKDVDTSDRTTGKCRTCGISPENISVSTGNCYDCDDKQPQLFDYQLKPTQIQGRSVHASLFRRSSQPTIEIVDLRDTVEADPKYPSHSEWEASDQAQRLREQGVIHDDMGGAFPITAWEADPQHWMLAIGRDDGFHNEMDESLPSAPQWNATDEEGIPFLKKGRYTPPSDLTFYGAGWSGDIPVLEPEIEKAMLAKLQEHFGLTVPKFGSVHSGLSKQADGLYDTPHLDIKDQSGDVDWDVEDVPWIYAETGKWRELEIGAPDDTHSALGAWGDLTIYGRVGRGRIEMVGVENAEGDSMIDADIPKDVLDYLAKKMNGTEVKFSSHGELTT